VTERATQHGRSRDDHVDTSAWHSEGRRVVDLSVGRQRSSPHPWPRHTSLAGGHRRWSGNR
jgi:hypothetical protein